MSEKSLITISWIFAITAIAIFFLLSNCQRNQDTEYARANIGRYSTPAPAPPK